MISVESQKNKHANNRHMPTKQDGHIILRFLIRDANIIFTNFLSNSNGLRLLNFHTNNQCIKYLGTVPMHSKWVKMNDQDDTYSFLLL